MEIVNRDRITEQSILDSTDSKYIKGYFCFKDKINNNDDFIELYRYLQYWNLPITDELYNYVKYENYAPKSLIENMRLTGEDSYFEQLSLKNEKYENKDTEEELTFEKILENPEYAKCGYEQGVSINYDLITKDNANKFIHIIRSYGDSVEDLTICNMIRKGLGGLVSLFLSEANDIDFIYDDQFFPLDYDSLILYSVFKEITHERAEYFFSSFFELPRDTALFMKLLEYLPENFYRSFLCNVLNCGNKLLITLFINHFKISNNEIEELIIFSIRSKEAYITFKLNICDEKDYDSIIENSEFIGDEIW